MKEKSLTDAKLQEIKNEVKTIIKKTKKKVVVTEQRESESEDEEIFIELDSKGKAVLLKECKEPVESFLCDTQKKMISTMKTKIILTKMINLLPKSC